MHHKSRVPLSSPEAAELVSGFLAGDTKTRQKLARTMEERFRKQLLKMVGEVAPDLARLDHSKDVVQQTYELLVRKPEGHFDPTRGTAGDYFKVLMRNAAQPVRAAHTPPGQRTRAYRVSSDTTRKGPQEGYPSSYTTAMGESGDKKKVYQQPVISLDKAVVADGMEEAGTTGSTLADLVEDPEDTFENMHLACDIERAFGAIPNAAPPWLREVLELIYYQDRTITEAALAVGQDRFRVRRAINRWVRPMSHLAA